MRQVRNSSHVAGIAQASTCTGLQPLPHLTSQSARSRMEIIRKTRAIRVRKYTNDVRVTKKADEMGCAGRVHQITLMTRKARTNSNARICGDRSKHHPSPLST